MEGRPERALLSYDTTGPQILLEKKIDANIEKVFRIECDVLIDKGSKSVRVLRSQLLNIKLNPILKTEKQYSVDGNRPEPLYPPSTKGWFSRIDRTGLNVIVFVHRIVDDFRLWLVILSKSDFRVLEAHPIFPFEVGALEFEEEFEEYSSFFASKKSLIKAKKWMNSVLVSESPTWEQLTKLIHDVHIPNLRLGKDARNTMQQLIPEAYEDIVREQIMAFFTLVSRWDIPREDPVDYFNRIYPLDVLNTLLLGYVIRKFSDMDIPSYVRIIQRSSRHQLALPSSAIRDEEWNPWTPALFRIVETTPSVFRKAIECTAELNRTKKIVVSLPITRKEASESQENWKNRFLLLASGLRIRTHLRPQALGLVGLIDVTRAHQWPHKHMKWSASIAAQSYREPHIQIMEMPPLAVDRVKKIRPNVITLDWSASITNANLYDFHENSWRVSFKRIQNSLLGNQTLKKLESEFGTWIGQKPYQPKRKWVKCLDATANLGYLASFEQLEYLQKLGLTREELLDAIMEMKKKTVVDISYTPVFRNHMTIALIAQGRSGQICSFVQGFLKHSPSATVFVARGGRWSLIMARVPPSIARQIMIELPGKAAEQDLALSCYRVVSYRSYSWRFYQRILNEDDTWNDDVSAMLSQIRLPYPDNDD